MKKVGVFPVLLLTATVSLVGMTVYELLKQLLWPDISVWESHLITILAVSCFITAMVYFVLRDRQRRMDGLTRTLQQRAEAERHIRKVEAEKDLVLNSISDIVTYQDPAMHILWANQAAVRIAGIPQEKMIGLTCQEAYSHSPEYCTACPVRLALQNRREEEGEVRLRDGKVWLVRAHVVRNGGEEIRGVVTVASDITALQAAQEERSRMDRKRLHEQRLESLAVLAGGIAHDFNNLLVGILGNADLALNELDRGISTRRTVENIKQASLRAADLTNQMLAFSGKGSFLVKPLKLNDLLLGMTPRLEAALSPRTKLRFELSEHLPAIEGDETQLRQVIMNLVVNASESILNPPGEITVRTGREHVSRDRLREADVGDNLPSGHYLVLEVSDNGCGMDEQTRSRLFEPFFTTKFPGRGLGLSAVMGIVRGHGGAIFVSSRLGEGSTFRVLLPFKTSAGKHCPAGFRAG